jgi:hypothetical protein
VQRQPKPSQGRKKGWPLNFGGPNASQGHQEHGKNVNQTLLKEEKRVTFELGRAKLPSGTRSTCLENQTLLNMHQTMTAKDYQDRGTINRINRQQHPPHRKFRIY